MNRFRIRLPSIGAFGYFGFLLLLYGYFSYSALQGESGLFKRIIVEDQISQLQEELDRQEKEIARMQNLTKRLSNSYLDLELLDERARAILGMVRDDEIIIN